MVVEDDDDIRADLTAILRAKGFAVAEAANGREALTQLRDGVHPSLVLLDLMMPIMNGWELRAAMREDPVLRAIPVVVVTGAGRLGAKELAALEAATVLAKPFELQQLIELVARYCNR